MTKEQISTSLKTIEKNIKNFHPDGEMAYMMRKRYNELKLIKP